MVQSIKPETKALMGGMASLLLTLGIARFAYTPLLPLMQHDLGWFGESEGGILAAVNYAGYFAGALSAALISDIQIKNKLYRLCLVLAVISTALMPLVENFAVWTVLRFMAGYSGAGGMLFATGLVLHFLLQRGQRIRMALQFTGIGMGIILSAVAVAAFEPFFTWQQQWLGFAVLAVPLALVAHIWVPHPQGEVKGTIGKAEGHRSYLRILQVAYFCAGYGFVVAATFQVDVIKSQPGLEILGNWAWALVGIAVIPACFFWERMAEKFSPVKALLMAHAIHAAGYVLAATSTNGMAQLFSALLFGGTFIGMVSLVLVMVGKLYPQSPAKPMGRLTLAYGLGQVIGPAVTGWLAEQGGYSLPLLITAAVIVVGMVPLFLLMQRDAQALGKAEAKAL